MILVTGGAGFIGRRVVGAYVRAGHQVRVLDALLSDTHQEQVPPEFPDGVEFVAATCATSRPSWRHCAASNWSATMRP